MTRFRFTMLVAAVAVAAFPATLAVAWVRVLADGNTPSRVFGTVARGSIEHAHVIPPWGPGYVTYSFLGAAFVPLVLATARRPPHRTARA